MTASDLSNWLKLLTGRRQITPILQTDPAECGLACLAMVADYYGNRCGLAALRRTFAVSQRGATLATLINIASRLNLSTRAVRLDLASMRHLRLPCILHWRFDHFVILKQVKDRAARIVDPARGELTCSPDEVSKSFTGVALELWPNPGFEQAEKPKPVPLRSLLGHVTGLYRAFSHVLLLAFALEVITIVSPFFIQWVVDNAILSGDRSLLAVLALGFGTLAMFQVLVMYARSWLLLQLGASMNVQWRGNVFEHLTQLPGSYFERRHIGDIVSRFSSLDVIQRTLTTSFIEALLDGLMTLAVLVVLYLYSPLLASITVVAMVLYGIARLASYGAMRRATEDQLIYAARQQSHFLETVRSIKAIKLFGKQAERRSSWLSTLVDQLNADVQTQRLNLRVKCVNGVVFGLENIAIVWLGAEFVLRGAFSVGMLLAFMSYKSTFVTRVSSLIDHAVELKMLRLQGERLADVILTRREGGADVVNESAEAPIADASIEVHNLTFAYAEHEPQVIRNASFRVEDGECVAITGPSGCGKTTLLNVILGMLSPLSGQIVIGGINVQQIGVDGVRRWIGAVTQDDTLLEGSIVENICFFSDQFDFDWVQQCAKSAAIHNEILRMPMGYNTLVGFLGTTLSAGQRQRIVLARALYKRPKILLLDEATSQLDVACERQVTAAIAALKITRLVVAHRPETIAGADRVISFQGAEIVGRGTLAAPLGPAVTASA